jgi:TolA-binding protein
MHELEPVPDDLRALLEEEKAAGEPSRDTRERVLLRLAGTFAPGGPGGESLDAPSSASHVVPAARLAPAALAVRAAAIFVTGAAAGAGSYHVVERARHPAPISAPVVAPAPRPEMTAPPDATEPMPPPAPEPTPSAPDMPIRMRPRTTVEATPGAPERTDDPLAAERSLLEMARAALGRGKAESALAALRRHARQFPSGELMEEREGLLVQALVGAQKYDQAREKADQFKKRYPRSLFAPVVDQAVGSIP